MPITLVELAKNSFADRFKWHVVRSGLATDRPLASHEQVIWSDEASSLSVSRVVGAQSSHFRLSLNNEIYVDLQPHDRLDVYAEGHISLQAIDHFLADQVIPRAMAEAGHFVLHAGGIALQQKAILFIGPTGTGKSTLTASFTSAGALLMSDDAIVLSETSDELFAKGVYPSLRLLPDSVEALVSRGASTTSVSPFSTKQRVDMPEGLANDNRPRSIGAIIKLDGPVTGDRIDVRELSVAETCMALIQNSFMLDPSNMLQARRKLAVASTFADRLTAFAISIPRDYGRLAEVRGLIIDHLQ